MSSVSSHPPLCEQADPARRPEVVDVAQAASVLKAEAASGALSSPKGEAPRRGENGAARARNGSGRGGGGGGGGGSAMRFEDMMRDESVGAPAAAAPAWEADFSSFSAPVEAAGSGWADFDAGCESCGASAGASAGASSLPQGAGAAAVTEQLGTADLLGGFDGDAAAEAPWAAPDAESDAACSTNAGAGAGTAGRAAVLGGDASARQPSAESARGGERPSFSSGEQVIISGLRSRPELNDTVATVIGPAAAAGRFNVEGAGGAVYALKKENLHSRRSI